MSFICLSCATSNFFALTPLVNPDFSISTAPYPDSVVVQAGKHYKSGKLYSFFLGKHYRDTWSTPVKVRVLDLTIEQGGLVIEKAGGSMQSTSYTLRDKKGNKYSLRTVDKDPSGNLPAFFQKTIAADFMRDQTAALNPYAALVVAPLAEAAGIPHANPELVYLPADSVVLGEYTREAGDKLYMLEEKLEHKRVLKRDAASVVAIVDSEDLLKNRFRHNTHQVDQLAFAKARLLDIVINDRDRHQGQWNWSVHEKNGMKLYRPIPKDRDQAFYMFSGGLLSRVAGRGFNYQKFISFQNDYRDLKALFHKSDYIDRHFLSEVTQEQFDSLAKVMQKALTDEVIGNAVQALPKPVFEKIGSLTASTLKNRRDLLPDAANAFYKLLAKEVVVTGSDEEELVKVTRLQNGDAEVVMQRKAGSSIFYHRVFKADETKDITLFGLGGNDVFEIKGDVKQAIKISIYGGPGNDHITDLSRVEDLGKKTIIYDTAKENTISLGSEARFKALPERKADIFNRGGT